MATLLPLLKFQFANSAGQPYAGGSLEFYLTGTSTPQSVFPNENLTGGSTTVTLNSAGWPATDIFLTPGVKYKVVLKDSSGNTVWTVDPVSTTDLARVPLWVTTAGDPNGNTAGTAASSGVLPSVAWDRTNKLLYLCVTTGSASTAVWEAINASSATPVVTAPQGYLTITTANDPSPIITADVLADSTIHYMPFVGNLIPIYNGSRFVPTEFTTLTLTLNNPNHVANTIYDVFIFNNSGVLTIATGPAWADSGAGSGDRGTGAATTELTGLKGYLVNAVQITGRNGTTTYTIGANLATYIGSVLIDGTAGQTTCHRAWGQSRKWGVWNAYNRQPLYLKGGDPTASWPYNTATVRASNDDADNSLTVFQGLAEEWYDLRFRQKIRVDSLDSPAEARNGIGWNSTTTMSGFQGEVGIGDIETGDDMYIPGNGIAEYFQVPSLGINVVTALENVPTTAGDNVTWFGGEDDMVLSAKWRG